MPRWLAIALGAIASIPLAAAAPAAERTWRLLNLDDPIPAAPTTGGDRPSGVMAAEPTGAQQMDAERLRQNLFIPPVAQARRQGPEYSAPSLNPGLPSAYIANWGDYFIGVVGATQGNERDKVDGSVNLGFGLGDASKSLAVELALNIASLYDTGSNGTFDAKVERLLVDKSNFRLGASIGVVNIAEWGDAPKAYANPYGMVTAAWPLQLNNPSFTQTLQISAGVGGKTFAYSDDDSAGGFASIGVEVLPNVGLSAGWSGRGVNASVSLVPFKETPLTINLTAADVFDQTNNGPVGVLTIVWGSNFRTADF